VAWYANFGILLSSVKLRMPVEGESFKVHTPAKFNIQKEKFNILTKVKLSVHWKNQKIECPLEGIKRPTVHQRN
jgi:hypothetical protein